MKHFMPFLAASSIALIAFVDCVEKTFLLLIEFNKACVKAHILLCSCSLLQFPRDALIEDLVSASIRVNIVKRTTAPYLMSFIINFVFCPNSFTEVNSLAQELCCL